MELQIREEVLDMAHVNVIPHCFAEITVGASQRHKLFRESGHALLTSKSEEGIVCKPGRCKKSRKRAKMRCESTTHQTHDRKYSTADGARGAVARMIETTQANNIDTIMVEYFFLIRGLKDRVTTIEH